MAKLFRRDDKFSGEASFRVLYYGGAASTVPFTWESQPGTPKHPCSHDPLPPLTPPPSFKFRHRQNSPEIKQSPTAGTFFSSIFPRSVNSRKTNNSFSSSSTSSFSSSLYSLPSTPFNTRKNDKDSVFRFGFEEYENVRRNKSPDTTLCFGPGGKSTSGRKRSIKISVKKIVLSIVGNRKSTNV